MIRYDTICDMCAICALLARQNKTDVVARECERVRGYVRK